MNNIYITFSSVHDAIKFEETFKNKIYLKIIPAPRKITKSCDIAIKLTEKEYNKFLLLINKRNLKVKYKKIYKNII